MEFNKLDDRVICGSEPLLSDNSRDEESQIYVVDNNATWKDIMKYIIKCGQEDTFLVLDIDDIINKYKQWESFMNPIKTYYAVKANDNSAVLKALASLHSGFDCASKAEMNKVMKLIKYTKHSYLDSHPIIFANPAKIPEHILYAKSIGVDFMTFDNEEELHKLKKLYPSAKLLIRIRSDSKHARFNYGKKFGCDPVNEAPELIDLAKSLSLNVMGVAFHVGSLCMVPESFEQAIIDARSVFDYAKKSGIDFSVLDIGGGFPGSKYSSIKEYGDIIIPALQKNFSDIKISVISEPGLYYASSAFTLAVKIHSKKVIYNSDKTVSNIMYYVDNGIHGTFGPIRYGESCLQPVPLGEFHGEHFPSTIWGPTRSSLDCVIKNVAVPCLNIGDWITFEDMGAYTTVTTTNFNGFSPPKTFPFMRKSCWESMRNSPLFPEETFVFKDVLNN